MSDLDPARGILLSVLIGTTIWCLLVVAMLGWLT